MKLLCKWFNHIKTWRRRKRCNHVLQYKGSHSDGMRKYLEYECPYCGAKFENRL